MYDKASPRAGIAVDVDDLRTWYPEGYHVAMHLHDVRVLRSDQRSIQGRADGLKLNHPLFSSEHPVAVPANVVLLHPGLKLVFEARVGREHFL